MWWNREAEWVEVGPDVIGWLTLWRAGASVRCSASSTAAVFIPVRVPGQAGNGEMKLEKKRVRTWEVTRARQGSMQQE